MRFEIVSYLHITHQGNDTIIAAQTVNPDCHLIHVLQGRTRLVIAGQERMIGSNRVISIPPMTPYMCTRPPGKPLEMINYHYHLTDMTGRPLYYHVRLPLTFRPASLPLIHQRLLRWHDTWITAGHAERVGISSHLHHLTATYLQDHAVATPTEDIDDAMYRLKQQLDSTFARHFDADWYAEKCQLSASQMNRRFRQAFGISPNQYWQQARLIHIQEVLANTDMPIQDIAARCGFTSAYYFSRWFRKMTGVSPRQWRCTGNSPM